jgi:hypothetical protein
LARTKVGELLATRDAVILERIARGGGATNWYYCRGCEQLETVEQELSPGSVVSFYFDGRLRKTLDLSEVGAAIEKILAVAIDAVVGTLHDDGVHIAATTIGSVEELAEFASERSKTLFYGEFPARDNDGVQAVTVTLPDNDGIVRPHPH